MTSRRTFLSALPAGLLLAADPALPNRPKVPGTLKLRTRRRTKSGPTEKTVEWPVARTAIVICDMWDAHTCALSAQRVSNLAPRMNNVINAARSNGVMIIHAPSDTMKFYEGTPWRLNLNRAGGKTNPQYSDHRNRQRGSQGMATNVAESVPTNSELTICEEWAVQIEPCWAG